MRHVIEQCSPASVRSTAAPPLSLGRLLIAAFVMPDGHPAVKVRLDSFCIATYNAIVRAVLIDACPTLH